MFGLFLASEKGGGPRVASAVGTGCGQRVARRGLRPGLKLRDRGRWLFPGPRGVFFFFGGVAHQKKTGVVVEQKRGSIILRSCSLRITVQENLWLSGAMSH